MTSDVVTRRGDRVAVNGQGYCRQRRDAMNVTDDHGVRGRRCGNRPRMPGMHWYQFDREATFHLILHSNGCALFFSGFQLVAVKTRRQCQTRR